MKEFVQYLFYIIISFELGVLIIVKIKYLDKIWSASWKVMVFISFIYFCFLFIRIHWNEGKIKKLIIERDEKLRKNNGACVAMRVINGRNRRVNLDCQDEITTLERQRKFDLEKIPFIKN